MRFFFFGSALGNAHTNFLQITRYRYTIRTWPFLGMLMHLASLFFRITCTSTRASFFRLCSDLKFLMWACLKPHFASYMYSSNSCLNAGFFNDRVQSGFSLSNSASIFVLYSENVHSSSSGCVCLCMPTTLPARSYTEGKMVVGISIAQTELTDCEFNYFELTQL